VKWRNKENERQVLDADFAKNDNPGKKQPNKAKA
jgi:hypothetical protein